MCDKCFGYGFGGDRLKRDRLDKFRGAIRENQQRLDFCEVLTSSPTMSMATRSNGAMPGIRFICLLYRRWFSKFLAHVSQFHAMAQQATDIDGL